MAQTWKFSGRGKMSGSARRLLIGQRGLLQVHRVAGVFFVFYWETQRYWWKQQPTANGTSVVLKLWHYGIMALFCVSLHKEGKTHGCA